MLRRPNLLIIDDPGRPTTAKQSTAVMKWYREYFPVKKVNEMYKLNKKAEEASKWLRRRGWRIELWERGIGIPGDPPSAFGCILSSRPKRNGDHDVYTRFRKTPSGALLACADWTQWPGGGHWYTPRWPKGEEVD